MATQSKGVEGKLGQSEKTKQFPGIVGGLQSSSWNAGKAAYHVPNHHYKTRYVHLAAIIDLVVAISDGKYRKVGFIYVTSNSAADCLTDQLK